MMMAKHYLKNIFCTYVEEKNSKLPTLKKYPKTQKVTKTI